MPAQGTECASCDPWRPSHSIANHGHDGDVRVNIDVFHLFVRRVRCEGGTKLRQRSGSISRIDDEADVLSRQRLGDKQNVGLSNGGGSEGFSRDAG
jgi:hypothetical protein